MENNNNVYIIKSKPSMTAYIKDCDTRNNRVIYIREKLWEEKRKLYYYLVSSSMHIKKAKKKV